MIQIIMTMFQDKLERMNSGNNLDGSSPRKVLIEQLHRVLPSDDSLPEQVSQSFARKTS